ncbi:hypothetical protein [Phaeodactylibacter sp.]|jgi:hypothetical protein|uniref:hypothetical protein n=1 Tax=Phaeodactylibacter sp. TaxID=1940289 RepID=UPI0025E0D54D|nr:hypothetical protein [Phaeodactylibacter sp.]MCI4647451.1 hypothetical protein [Phaeodactylibacter sp.]MCI5091643.1 hypothetical protein [Phaeodactylibacter sp.]MCR9098430.1 hypothetical protein [bacterium]
MEYLGLLMELIFLVFGVYLYLFSIGRVQAGDPESRKKAEAFRQRNAGWMRIGALAIIAIMVVNLYLHFVQLSGK